MKTRNILIIAVTFLLFGLFFWPGLYQYEVIHLPNRQMTIQTRTNRITGKLQFYLPAAVWDTTDTGEIRPSRWEDWPRGF